MLDFYVNVYVVMDDCGVDFVNFVEVHGLEGHSQFLFTVSNLSQTVTASANGSLTLFTVY